MNMIELLQTYFSYGFVRYAFIAGVSGKTVLSASIDSYIPIITPFGCSSSTFT